MASTMMYSESIGRLACEVCYKVPEPEVMVIFRGALLDAEVVGRSIIVPKKFLRFIGVSSTFAIFRRGTDISLCSIEVVKEPRIYRNKLREPGLFRIASCRELVTLE